MNVLCGEDRVAEHKIAVNTTAIPAANVPDYARPMRVVGTSPFAHQKSPHAEYVDLAISENNGRILNSTRQSLLIAFVNADAAIVCAVAIQRAMIHREADFAIQRQVASWIDMRLSEVVSADSNYGDDGVKLTIQLDAIAGSEGVHISDAVFKSVRGKLGLGFVKLKPQRPKDVPDSTPSYKILLDPAEAGTMLAVRRSLPLHLTWVAGMGVIASWFLLASFMIFAH